MRSHRLVGLIAALAAPTTVGAIEPAASPVDERIWANVSATGTALAGLDAGELGQIAAAYPLRSSGSEPPFYEFGTGSVCNRLSPGAENADVSCANEASFCRSDDPARGLGPVVSVWVRQVVDARGRPAAGNWQYRGFTCFPEAVPGFRGVTMAMIRQAFHDTEFSVPTVNIQPEGDVTLVNLPTYFEVVFPRRGFGPDEVDEVDPARMLGELVQVRPRLLSVTYHLGVQVVGPTTDLGGPYPRGTVIARYPRPGEYRVRVDVTYAGQYRLGRDGAWRDIPGEVTRRGTPVMLTVREARSRLYTN